MVLTSESHQALLAAAERFCRQGRARLGPIALEGDVPGLAAALRRGRLPLLVKSHDWALPPALRSLEHGDGPDRLGFADEVLPFTPGVAVMRPPSLVIGVDEGGHRELPIAEIRRLTIALLAEHQLSISSVAGVLRARDGYDCESVALAGGGSTARMVVSRRNFGDVEIAITRRLRLAPLPNNAASYPWSEIIDLQPGR